MFCKQCGAQIPDGSAFCTSCGSPVSVSEKQPPVQPQVAQPAQNPYVQPQTANTNSQYAQPENPYVQPQAFDANGQPVQYAPVQTATVKTPMSPEKKKKFILFGSIGGGVVILAIVLIIIFSSFGKGANSSCSAVVDTYVSSVMNGDVDAYISIIPPEIVTYKVKNSYYGDYSAFKKSIEDTIDLSSMFSSSIKIRCEILGEKHCTDSKALMSVTEKYCDRYNASSQITDIAKCELKTYITYGNLGTPSTETETVYMIKIGGKWYMDDFDISSSVSSSKFH